MFSLIDFKESKKKEIKKFSLILYGKMTYLVIL